jgi:zinc protease
VLAGDIDAATARPLVETYFGDIPAGPEIERKTSLIPARPHNTSEIMYDKVPAARVNRVYVSPGRGERDSALLTLAGVILGSGKTSRLYTDIVYEGQTATDASASLSPFQLASVFNIDVLMKPGESPEAAAARIDTVLAEFLRSGPTAEELERAKTRINAQTIRGLERVGGFGGKAVTLAEGELYHGDPAFNLKRLEWINTATVADVTAAARAWLSNGYHQVTTLPNPTFANAAAGVDRSTGLPATGDMPTLAFPAIVEDRLRNGVRVVLAERSTIPVVQVVASFDAGFAADSITGKLGLADITLDMLDEGAGRLDALQIAARAESLGAILSAGSGLDTSTVSLNALKSNLGPSLELWASLILEPTFADADIERLRTTLLADIRQEKANPTALARRLLPPLMFGAGHAYAAPLTGSGTEETVAGIARADIVDFHRTWLRPSNMTIFVVGDTTMAEIKPLLERSIGRMPEPQGALPQKNTAPVALGAAPRMIVVDKPGSPQSFILAGHVSPSTSDPNIIALDAANEAIGGSFTARVNMNLREDKGWSYGARTFALDAVGQRPWLINAPVQTDKTGDSIREIQKELADYRGGRPITAEELDRLVKNNTRALPGQFETAGAVMGEILSNARFGRPLDYATQLVELYSALTTDQVAAAAQDLIQPESIIWVVVGDRAKVEPQLQGLGFGAIEFMDENGNLVQ